MRILFCQPTMDRSGSENSLLEIMRGLEEHTDHQMYLLAGRNGPMVEAFNELTEETWLVNAPKLKRSFSNFWGFLLSFWTLIGEIRKIKKSSGISVVYVNTLMFPQALIGAFLNRLRTIVHIREVETRYPRFAYRTYMRLAALLADRIICVSRSVAEQKRLPMRLRFLRKAEVIYNSSGFSAAPINRKIESSVRILAVVPVIERKGIRDLVRLVKILRDRMMRDMFTRSKIRIFHVKIAGRIEDAKLFENLSFYLKRENLSDTISFVGEQPDLVPLYKEAHILVHPSLVEAFPRILVEAANFSLPAVTTDAGGAPEAVIDGHTGFVVPAGDAFAMADRVLRLARDEALYQRLSTNAFRRYQKLFHRSVVSTLLAGVIESR